MSLDIALSFDGRPFAFYAGIAGNGQRSDGTARKKGRIGIITVAGRFKKRRPWEPPLLRLLIVSWYGQ